VAANDPPQISAAEATLGIREARTTNAATRLRFFIRYARIFVCLRSLFAFVNPAMGDSQIKPFSQRLALTSRLEHLLPEGESTCTHIVLRSAA
jgi:hypothetical protein